MPEQNEVLRVITFSPSLPGGPRGPVMPTSPTVPFKPLSPGFPLSPGGPYLVTGDDNQESLTSAAISRHKANLVSNLSEGSCGTLESFHSLPTKSHSDTAIGTELKPSQADLNPMVSFLSLFSFESSVALSKKSNFSVYKAKFLPLQYYKFRVTVSTHTLLPLNPSNPFKPSTPSSPWQG